MRVEQLNESTGGSATQVYGTEGLMFHAKKKRNLGGEQQRTEAERGSHAAPNNK